jgi:hypothetical protein
MRNDQRRIDCDGKISMTPADQVAACITNTEKK